MSRLLVIALMAIAALLIVRWLQTPSRGRGRSNGDGGSSDGGGGSHHGGCDGGSDGGGGDGGGGGD